MLKVIVIIVIAIAALWLLLEIVIPMLAAVACGLLDVFTRKEEDATGQPETVSPDDAAYAALAKTAAEFEARPSVTVVAGVYMTPDDTVLFRNASDIFGRREFIETQRRCGKTLHVVLRVQEDGRQVALAAREIPVSQVHWDAHFAAIEDLRAHGAFVSYFDRDGRRRETRLPNGRMHHA